jgi:hypothetical protein
LTNGLKSGFRGGKNKTKQKVVEFKGRREREQKQKKLVGDIAIGIKHLQVLSIIEERV